MHISTNQFENELSPEVEVVCSPSNIYTHKPTNISSLSSLSVSFLSEESAISHSITPPHTINKNMSISCTERSDSPSVIPTVSDVYLSLTKRMARLNGNIYEFMERKAVKKIAHPL